MPEMTDSTVSIASENLQIAAALGDALVGADAAVLQRLLSPEIIWHFPGQGHALAGDHEGIAEIAVFAAKVNKLTAGTFRIEARETYGGESGAVIAFTGRGTRPDGRELDNPTQLVLQIVDRRVEEIWEFVWDTEAVAAFWR
jgi:ketosteroid isomerase-like protein